MRFGSQTTFKGEGEAQALPWNGLARDAIWGDSGQDQAAIGNGHRLLQGQFNGLDDLPSERTYER